MKGKTHRPPGTRLQLCSPLLRKLRRYGPNSSISACTLASKAVDNVLELVGNPIKTLFELAVFGVIRGGRHMPENFFNIFERPTEAHGTVGLHYTPKQELRAQERVLTNVGNFSSGEDH
jgi:hypothetical protein